MRIFLAVGNSQRLRPTLFVEAGSIRQRIDAPATRAREICGRRVLYELLKINRIERRSKAVEGCDSGSRRRANILAIVLVDCVALEISKEEELVPEDRAAELTAVAVVIVVRIWNL